MSPKAGGGQSVNEGNCAVTHSSVRKRNNLLNWGLQELTKRMTHTCLDSIWKQQRNTLNQWLTYKDDWSLAHLTFNKTCSQPPICSDPSWGLLFARIALSR
eukprot:1159490-Pelagomonas_calceolata.AAC.1